MWGTIAAIAIPTILGAIKGNRQKKLAKKERAAQANIAKWSPWTGIAPQNVAEVDPMDAMMQGAMTGAMLGQGVEQMKASQGLLDSQKQLMSAQASAYNRMPAGKMPQQPISNDRLFNQMSTSTRQSNQWF